MLIDDINFIERNYLSLLEVSIFSEPWSRIKKAALESLQLPITAVKTPAASTPQAGNCSNCGGAVVRIYISDNKNMRLCCCCGTSWLENFF